MDGFLTKLVGHAISTSIPEWAFKGPASDLCFDPNGPLAYSRAAASDSIRDFGSWGVIQAYGKGANIFEEK